MTRMMKNSNLIARMFRLQILRKWIYIIGSFLAIVGLLTYYVCRYFNLLEPKVNSYLYCCLLSAGLSMIFLANTHKEITLKNDISGVGALIFAYVFIIYLGDFFIDDWWYTKSIYIIIGTVIICLLWKIYRHFRLRCG